MLVVESEEGKLKITRLKSDCTRVLTEADDQALNFELFLKILNFGYFWTSPCQISHCICRQNISIKSD